MKAQLRHFLLACGGLAIGLAIGLVIAAIAGEKPLHVLMVIAKSAFGSRYDLGVTLYYCTPLIFTGLSVAVAFHAGLFNIGAEGQLNIGTLVATIAALAFPGLPPLIAPLFAVACGMLAGGFWAWIAGWLRTMRGSHEVITTIMLNFIASALASWAITARLQNPESQNPETHLVAPAYFFRTMDPIARWFGDAPVSLAFPCAVVVAIAVWIFLYRTPYGFELRACGQNERAAAASGINVARTRQVAMFLAGALAAGVAIGEVFGASGKYKLGFSPDFGFIGIAVALLARNNPFGILLTAFLFAALHKGAADLDIETENVTRDLSLVIQALVILAVAILSSMRFGRKGRSA
ncbi:MAG: ABC transporter permease [Bdellovibrionota bacterium]